MNLLEELKFRVRLAASGGSLADHFHRRLKEGGLAEVLDYIRQRPEALAELLPIVANPEASMNVRLGASVVFERQAGSRALTALLPGLGELADHADARVRADACHFLGLTGQPAAARYLRSRLADEDGDVREIAAESLAALGDGER